MSDVLAAGVRWCAEGVGNGRAVLVTAVGSSPFEVGSLLLASGDGRLAGSVSAGCIEGALTDAILAARGRACRELVHFGVSDERAAEVGLSCGGTIDVLVEPEVPPELLAAAAEGRTVALVTPLPVGREEPLVNRLLVDATGAHSGSLGDATHDEMTIGLARTALRDEGSLTAEVGGRQLVVEGLAPVRLVIAGAGDVAVYLVRFAHAVGFHTIVVDPRAAFLTRERFADADALLAGWADDLADQAGIDDGAHVLALAHDPKIDDPAIATALRRGTRYVGALGSRRSHAQRLARLREAGLSDQDLDRIHGPCRTRPRREHSGRHRARDPVRDRLGAPHPPPRVAWPIVSVSTLRAVHSGMAWRR